MSLRGLSLRRLSLLLDLRLIPAIPPLPALLLLAFRRSWRWGRWLSLLRNRTSRWDVAPVRRRRLGLRRRGGNLRLNPLLLLWLLPLVPIVAIAALGRLSLSYRGGSLRRPIRKTLPDGCLRNLNRLGRRLRLGSLLSGRAALGLRPLRSLHTLHIHNSNRSVRGRHALADLLNRRGWKGPAGILGDRLLLPVERDSRGSGSGTRHNRAAQYPIRRTASLPVLFSRAQNSFALRCNRRGPVNLRRPELSRR